MVWQAHHNSSQAVIGVDVCIIIETVHDGETIDDIQWECFESFSIVSSNLLSRCQFVDHCSGYDTWLAELLL